MNLVTHSHRSAEDVLPKAVVRSLIDCVQKLEFEFTHGCSSRLREQILDTLRLLGWSDRVRLTAHSKITITAMHSNVALCLQTGNMSRFYADLLKLEYLFKDRKAIAAVYIIPTKRRAREMGSNLAHFERFVEELDLFKDIITVPTLVIGLE